VSRARGAVGFGPWPEVLGERSEPGPEGPWAWTESDQEWSLVVPRAGWAERLRPGPGPKSHPVVG